MKLDSPWSQGVWLGRTDQTGENIGGTADGVTTARGLKRFPQGDQFSAQTVQSIVGLPRNPNGTQEMSMSTRLQLGDAMVSQRRMYITKGTVG